jgi:hypothetical protein
VIVGEAQDDGNSVRGIVKKPAHFASLIHAPNIVDMRTDVYAQKLSQVDYEELGAAMQVWAGVAR